MNCPSCGAQLLPNAQFCGACGTRLAAQAAAPQANTGASSYQQQPQQAG
ncbi:MAG: zinc-ribbon domain-containing protein, partial [Acidobacteriota bacterium]|nr:zinc-ribbon domain-containing protein [Acidobacteriota bacterium]